MENQTIRATSRATDRATGLSPATRDPYRRLAAGILAQAAKEAKAGDIDAAQWLQTGLAELFCDGVGLSFPHVKRWAGERLQSSP